MTEKEKVEKMAALVKAAKDALKEAEKFADEHSLVFAWDNEYGCKKQDYVGKGHPLDGFVWDIKKGELSEGEWVSSSDMCD